MAWNPQNQPNQSYPSPMNNNMLLSPQRQSNPQPQQQQLSMYPPHPLQTQTPQSHQQPMNRSPNHQPHQIRPSPPQTPSYPINPSPANYHQNYPFPMQQTYPSPFNNTPFFGLPPLPSQQPIISPFQRQFNPNFNNTPNHENPSDPQLQQQQQNMNSTQPLPQQQSNPFNFNNNNNNLSQTQPLYPQSPMQPAEEEKVMSSGDIENPQPPQHDDENEKPKPRLEYSKMALLGPTTKWVLNGREPTNTQQQITEEEKIFGDIISKYNEFQSNQTQKNIDDNTKRQQCRLYLDYKSRKQRLLKHDEDEKHPQDAIAEIPEFQNIDTKSQALLVYDHNIRPYYAPFNEYHRYKLLRIPPISSYPSTPPITITLHIYNVQFKDLPYFTVEDYLSQQIIFDYKIYAQYLRDEKSFGTKVTLLRTRIDQLLRNINNATLEIKQECISKLDELVTIRQNKDELHSQIRALFTKIYMNWRNLQSWRYNHGPYKFASHSSLISNDNEHNNTIYQGTKLMLYLKKMEPNRVQQQLEYTQAIKDELYEIKHLVQLRNEVNRLQIKQGDGDGGDNQQHLMGMMEEKFDEEVMRESIIQRQNAYLMTPGSVYYIAFIDTNSCNVSQTDLCNATERFRRRQLSNYSIRANVFVNNDDGNTKIKSTKITTTDKIYAEFPSFQCKVQFELEMKVLDQLRSVEVELRANSWFSSKKITNLHIPINTQMIKQQHGKLMQNEVVFDSEMLIPISRYLTSEDYQTYIQPANGDWNRKISGGISYGIKIDITEQYKRKISKQSNEVMTVNVIQDNNQQIEDGEELNNKQNDENKEEAVEQKEDEQVDHDPNMNEIQMNSIKDELEELLLIKDEDDHNLMEDKKHETFRQQILKLRQRFAISEDECVPLFDNDIPDHLYKAVHDETKQEIAYRNEIILDRVNNATIDVSEVIREFNVDLLPCCSFSIYSLFKPRRKLRPHRNYFALTTSAINPEKCKIIVQILQCRNLPIRKTNSLRVQNQGNMNMANMNIVQPFIEISFMGNTCRSFTSFGPNARWEQTLFVEFTPPGNKKYTPSNLQKINDDLEINLYDELILSKQDDDRAANSQIQRKEKRYLGSVKIPFTTIYFNKNIEGFFKLNVPLIQLGYTKSHNLQQINDPTLISLFATLDPPILNPHQLNENVIDRNNENYYQWLLNNNKVDENVDFIQYCIEWSKSIKNGSYYDIPYGRDIEIFVSNSRNEPDLVCRYLRSVEPPMQVTPEIFIRFVSCIPYKEDIHLIPGARDVWMSNVDFLNLASGDNEEHANLLACYFMWYDDQNPNNGWSTYIAIGKSIPEGGNNTLYVLRRNAVLKHNGGVTVQNLIIYDASNGLSYPMPQQSHQSISLCNLVDISIVYNNQQIYANLQGEINPSLEMFNWEFENKQFWRPLFDDNNRNSKWKSENYCLPSLQEPMLEYVSLSNEYYMKRQHKLEYIIEKQFDEWRDLPTKWNYAICKTLREILQRLEPICQNGGHLPMNNQTENDPQIFAINQIYSKLYGFPLNIKDNGSDNLLLEAMENKAVSAVFNTKVHENDDPNAEFARAVYIYPYTNKVASVWIYIASLSKQ